MTLAPIPLATAEQVAARIVRGVRRKADVVYAPGYWKLILLVVRHLPQFVFKRLRL